jgi:hypothetical protein
MLDRRLAMQSFALGLAGTLSRPAFAQAPTALLDPGPLPEKVFGAAEAPVTVIEYASLTCHHCMNFHMKTWPELKAKYVDTGKVRFIIREFPARSAGDGRLHARSLRRRGQMVPGRRHVSTGRRKAGPIPTSRWTG